MIKKNLMCVNQENASKLIQKGVAAELVDLHLLLY